MADKPPPGSTISAWQKILWRLQAAQPSSGLPSAYDYWGDIFAVPEDLADPPASTWRRFQHLIEDTTSTTTADDFVMTMDLINYTNGTVDNTWTDTDYLGVQGAANAFFTSVMPLFNTRYRYVGYKAYVMMFNEPPYEKPFADSGPPEDVWPAAIPGGSAGTIPPQPACTVTEMTPSRANWGRFYLPCPAGTSITGSGRLSTTVVDQLASAADTFYNALYASQLIPCVPATSSGGQQIATLQSVSGIRVDDVIDVQRRRRHKFKSYFKDYPVVAAAKPAGTDE